MPRDYTVDIAERVRELMYDTVVGPEAEVTYSFSQGYEKLTIRRKPTYGSSEYAGSYHPDGVCEGGGICNYCGRTLVFD